MMVATFLVYLVLSLSLLGIIAGGCGAVVGTPAEISLIRMTSDGRLPSEQRRGYKNVFDALFRITKEEGVMTLWRVEFPLSIDVFN